MARMLFLIVTVVFLNNVVFSIRILSPAAGSLWNFSSAIPVQIEIGRNDQSEFTYSIDGGEYKHFSERTVDYLHSLSPGFHNVTVIGRSNLASLIASYFLVVEPETMQPFDCLQAYPHIRNDEYVPGLGSFVWKRYELCLAEFLQAFQPANDLRLEYCKVLEISGLWAEATRCYNESLSSEQRQNSLVAEKLDSLLTLTEQQSQRDSCIWERTDRCQQGHGQQGQDNDSCQGGHDHAPLVNDEEDLYLSVIMVSRHDNTQYCQVPPDSCLERLRCSLSVLLHQLSSSGLARQTEIILVEWNPCYLNSRQDEGACDPRDDAYMSLEEAVRNLVDIPNEAASIRILLVTEEMHNSLYNPYDFDLMEFIGKNVAARRARGKFLLFTNPDDCLSDAMVAMLARRRLRDDVVYSTFRGAVLQPVPLGRGASGLSMRRFVQGNSRSSEDQPVSVAHQAGRWRRAACGEGDADEEAMRSGLYGYYHDSAAGDFLLIAKRRLAGFRGYPEIPTNIMIDGTALHAAAAHGMGQLVLAGDCVIWHQPHPRSYNTRGSMLSLAAYEALAQQLLDAGPLANIAPEPPPPDPGQRQWHRWNDANWGLAGARVPQVVLAANCG